MTGVIYNSSVFPLCKLYNISLLLSCFASPAVYFICRKYTKALFAVSQIFFVLRKKDKQISFLHVYHHASQVIFTWACLKYLPGKGRYVTAIHLQELNFTVY
jgi:hypothetical protein